MSNFVAVQDAVVTAYLEFGTITTDSIQQFQCVSGEIAGFQITQLEDGPDGEPLYISLVLDCSGDEPVQKGSVAVLPGIDLTGGLFSSGVLPLSDPLAENTQFVKVDYA